MTPARIVVGSVVIALALGWAVWLHSGLKVDRPVGGLQYAPGFVPDTPSASFKRKATWQDPLAIFVAVAGLGLGAAIIVSRPRRASPSS